MAVIIIHVLYVSAYK